MHLTICIVLLLTVSAVLNASHAAQMAGVGNWGEALGEIAFGPLAFFFIAHVIIYYAIRAIRGREKLKSFSATKLNYIAFTLALMGILGAIAQRAGPPV
ncbi:hypothetical protein RMR21_003765 [Agrobacterium sp. rho-8.1]|nr:hypothetical protein [Agrobacterium sp. rho-8.1]